MSIELAALDPFVDGTSRCSQVLGGFRNSEHWGSLTVLLVERIKVRGDPLIDQLHQRCRCIGA
jgi:hypothetical protein